MFTKSLYIFIGLLLMHGMASAQSTNKIDSLKTILKNPKNATQRADAHLALTDLYDGVDNDAATYHLKKAQQIALTNNLKKQNIQVQLILAQQATNKGLYKEAQAIYKAQASPVKQLDEYDMLVKYHGDQGILQFYQGDFKKAQSMFQTAFDIAKKANNKVDQLRYLGNLATAMGYNGETTQAIEVHNNVIALALKLKDSVALAKSYNNLGLVYDEMSQYDRALGMYKKALAIKKKVSPLEDILKSRMNINGMQLALSKKLATQSDTLTIKAVQNDYKELIKLAQENNLGKLEIQFLNGLAMSYSALQDKAQAVKVYEQIYQLALESGDLEAQRVVALNLGINNYQLYNDAQSLQYLQIAQPLIEENGSLSEKAKVNKYLAMINEAYGNYKEAYAFSKKQIGYEKELASTDLQDAIATVEVKYKTAEKEQEILKQKAALAQNQLAIQRRNFWILGLSLGATILGLIGYLVYRQQKLKNDQLKKQKELELALAQVDTFNKLEEQRLRISRDLHDNIGSQLTYVISTMDTMKYGMNKGKTVTIDKLDALATYTRSTISDLRDTIWAMNKKDITVVDLMERTTQLKAVVEDATTQTKVSINEQSIAHTYTSFDGMNIFRIIQETINNAVKHAQAAHINVEIVAIDNHIEYTITDDGIGFNQDTIEMGHGSRIMEQRAKEIGATYKRISKLGNGTQTTLTVPLDKFNPVKVAS